MADMGLNNVKKFVEQLGSLGFLKNVNAIPNSVGGIESMRIKFTDTGTATAFMQKLPEIISAYDTIFAEQEGFDQSKLSRIDDINAILKGKLVAVEPPESPGTENKKPRWNQ
jgi:hypothetical protein